MNERPHTISTAYEKGHQRPALSVYTFQPLEHAASSTCSGSGSIASDKFDRNNSATPTSGTFPETPPFLPADCAFNDMTFYIEKKKTKKQKQSWQSTKRSAVVGS